MEDPESVRGLWTEARGLIDPGGVDSGGAEKGWNHLLLLSSSSETTSLPTNLSSSPQLPRVTSQPSPSLWSNDASLCRTLSGRSEIHLLTVKLELELDELEKMVPWCSVDPYPASDEIVAKKSSSFPLYFDGPKSFQCIVRAGEILYLV